MFNKRLPIIVHNIRMGEATNSSSSHSLVFLQRDRYQQVRDKTDDFEFGWDFFTVASREAKTNYLAVLLNSTLEAYKVDEDVRKQIVTEWVGKFPFKPDEYFENGYIDHQSMIYIPKEYGSDLPNRQLFDAFQELILTDGVVIVGGNDNTEHEHDLIQEGNPNVSVRSIPYSEDYRLIARKDEQQDFWTVFSTETGNKVRFSFNDPNAEPVETDSRFFDMPITVTHASTPELVDMTITDFCAEGCEYCYMGSTVDGKHASYEDIKNILKALADMKVFEVAIGGGSPVSHPDFVKILQRARKLGIVPNFTTRSIAWITKPIAKKIMKHVGAFAVSVDSHKKIFKLARALKKADIHPNQVNIHVVMGTISREEYSKILVAASRQGFRVTLLGFKETGRGIGFSKIDYSWWLEDIKTLRDLDRNAPTFQVRKRKLYIGTSQGYMPSVSIDTVMAHDYEKELLEADVPRWMFHTVDGAFSAYVDAVSNTMGPASYELPEKMTKFDPSSKKLGQEMRRIFQSFDIKEG